MVVRDKAARATGKPVPPRLLVACGVALLAAACGGTAGTSSFAARGTASAETASPSPASTPSPSPPPLSTKHVLGSFRGGSPFTVAGGVIWAGRDLHGAAGAGATPGLIRLDAATGALSSASLDLPENPTDVKEAGGVVRVVTPQAFLLVDASTMKVLARVVTTDAVQVAIGADADWVSDDGSVLRVDQRTHSVTATVRVAPPAVAAAADQGEPSQLVLSGGWLWATMDIEQSVARIDPARAVVVGSSHLPYGDINTMVAASDGGVWVDLFSDGRFVHVDATGNVEALPAQVAQPVGFAVVGNDLWVASHRVGELWRVDRASGDVLERITIGAPAGQVAAEGSVIYAWGEGTITRVDAS